VQGVQADYRALQKGSWNGAVHGVHRLHKASNALDTAWQGGGQHQARGQQQSISPTRQSYRHASPTRPRQALAPQERDSEHSPPGGWSPFPSGRSSATTLPLKQMADHEVL